MRKIRIITALCLTYFLFACGENKSQDKQVEIPVVGDKRWLAQYIEAPASIDSTCIKELERAKQDALNGTITVCYETGMAAPNLRQEKHLKELCGKKGLLFAYDFDGDVIVEDQTTGCYRAYMDKIIASRFGANFKQSLLDQADSILIAENDTVMYYKCDERPQIPGKHDYEITLEVATPEKIRKNLKADERGNFPFMDIGFYIDKEGNATGYFINGFFDARQESNQEYKDELFRLGVERLMGIKHWDAGEVRAHKVITQNNVRVYF